MIRRGEPGVDLARQRFDELLHHHHAALHAYVRVVYPDAHADAVVNMTFVQLWQHLDDVADHSVRLWLRATARHEVLNSNRRDRRWYATTDRAARMATNLPQPPPDLDPSVDLAVVVAALGTLGLADREVVLMTALEDLTSTDLAEILGVQPDAARRRLSSARIPLRRPPPAASPPHAAPRHRLHRRHTRPPETPRARVTDAPAPRDRSPRSGANRQDSSPWGRASCGGQERNLSPDSAEMTVPAFASRLCSRGRRRCDD